MPEPLPPPADQPLDTATIVAAYASAPIGVTITRDGITEYCNPVYLQMFGYEGHEDEIYGKPLFLMIPPEHHAPILHRIAARRHGEATDDSYDTWGLRRDGTTFPFHVAVRRIALDGGPATLAFFFDLTERKRLDEELRQTSEQLSALVEACPVPTMMIDPEGLVRVWNPAAVAAFGWTEEEALGHHNPIVRSEHREEFARNIAQAMAGGLKGKPARRRHKNGSEVDIEIFAAPVRDAGGTPIGTMALVLDVTERNRTQDALRRSEEQLRHAHKMEAMGRFASGVAHDFNNLLTVISGFAEALARDRGAGNNPAGAAEAVKELRRAIDRASTLTRQLLAFGRRSRLEFRDVDLGDLIKGMEPMLRVLLGPGVSLATELEPQLGPARADPRQLEQVITNLVVNARDAMPAGGLLSLRTREARLREELVADRFPVPPGHYVVVSVTDQGVGMDEAVLSRLFEPFFTTKAPGHGTGLGLSTALGIVQQCGGHLCARSQPGAGSTFEIFLPRTPAA